jgi:hypothetical protein
MEKEKKVDYSTMNIYQKIQLVKEEILKENLKKSGENKYAGFKYYELADFTPSIIKLCNKVGLFTKITFSEELATLKIINVDKSEEVEEYTSPMRNLVLKGCNEIQALGGVETYSRRYLYMSAFDIIENDMFDAKSGEVEESKATPKQIEILEKVYVGETREKLLKANNVDKLEDLSVKKASELIKKLKERSAENGNS